MTEKEEVEEEFGVKRKIKIRKRRKDVAKEVEKDDVRKKKNKDKRGKLR